MSLVRSVFGVERKVQENADACIFSSAFLVSVSDASVPVRVVHMCLSANSWYSLFLIRNGIWAGQTLSINTIRPSDPSCGASGHRLSSRGLLDAEVPGAAATGSQQSAHHIALIIGICIGVAVCMIILCFVAFVFFLRRTGRWRWGRRGSQDVMPRTWTSDAGGDTTLVASTFISPLKNKRSHDFAKMKARSEPKLTLDTIDDDSNSRTSPCTIDDTQTSSSVYNHPRLRLDIEVLDISPANNPDPQSTALQCQGCRGRMLFGKSRALFAKCRRNFPIFERHLHTQPPFTHSTNKESLPVQRSIHRLTPQSCITSAPTNTDAGYTR